MYGQSYHRKGVGVYWVLALEYQKRGAIHFHALIGADVNLNQVLSRKDQESRWDKLAGFSRIAPIDDRLAAVTNYLSKYVVKGGEIEVSETLKNWSQTQGSLLEFESN